MTASRSILIGLILFTLFSLSGCKKTEGTYSLSSQYAYAERNTTNGKTYFSFAHGIMATNGITAKINSWEYRLYDEDQNLILTVNEGNYTDLGYAISAQVSVIQLYIPGGLAVSTNGPVDLDVFNGLVPWRVILEATIEDANGYELTFSWATNVDFQTVD